MAWNPILCTQSLRAGALGYRISPRLGLPSCRFSSRALPRVACDLTVPGFLWRALLVLAVLTAFGLPGVAFAQQVRRVAAPVVDDDEDVVEEVLVQPAFIMADENFDQWLYREYRNAAGARGRLDALLVMQMENVSQTCGLTDLQRKKLQLAGHGDIKRFFDSVEDLRRKFQTAKTDQNKIQELLREIQPVHAVLNPGPFGDGSLFSKALKTVLESDQKDLYETAVRERRRFQYRAAIELVITRLDEVLSLRAEQRSQLETILLEETQPPAQFGAYDFHFVMLQAAKLPEEKLKPLFDARQWKALSRQFARVRGLEPVLKNAGVLDGAGAGDIMQPVIRVAPAARLNVRPVRPLPKPRGEFQAP